MSDIRRLEALARRVRHDILVSTTQAGSGHPTSSLSATELMTALLFGGVFRYFADQPEHPNNDRLIFSKGHASPLFYALWAAAGEVSQDELLSYRRFGSPLEGHPTPAFPYTEAATGSLGQGLSIGVGAALNAKRLAGLAYRTYVLLGDSEMTEGSQWEAIQIAAHYGLDNLVGIIDVNRLGQRGETLYGHDVHAYERRVAAFGWETIVLDDGHALPAILDAYRRAWAARGRPVMIIARTIKGKGVSFLEDVGGMHGKALDHDQLDRALTEIGPVDTALRGQIAAPDHRQPAVPASATVPEPSYPADRQVATRAAYGAALKRLYPAYPRIVVLDAEISNSTKADVFAHAHPERFFEMYIAEQNMVGVALGLARRGQIPFVSTFAAFFTRAFDQIRMAQYSAADIKFCGSHAGVSIGEDGPSQMGLEDIAMFRTLQDGTVLYPADPYATERLVEEAVRRPGLVYLRTNRPDTPVIYGPGDRFPIGGSKVLRADDNDAVAVVSAGVTLHEALKAYEILLKEHGVHIAVIDLYSIKPIDADTLRAALSATGMILTVEEHRPEGGLGEAVRSALAGAGDDVYSLAVRAQPRSGSMEAQLDYQGISAAGIAAQVLRLVRG